MGDCIYVLQVGVQVYRYIQIGQGCIMSIYTIGRQNRDPGGHGV